MVRGGYRSLSVSLTEALEIIAERLEAEGWPKHPTPALCAKRRVAGLERDVDAAKRLLVRLQARAERNPVFGPSAERGAEHYNRALSSWAVARAKAASLAGKPCQPGAREEAARQLCRAGLDDEISFRGDLAGIPAGTARRALPPSAFAPGAQIGRSLISSSLLAGRALFLNVATKKAAIDRLWPAVAVFSEPATTVADGSAAAAVQQRQARIISALRELNAKGVLKPNTSAKAAQRMVLQHLGYQEAPVGFSADTIARLRKRALT